MLKIRHSLAQGSRPYSSISQYYSAKYFVPFQKQRDKLGRLLKSSHSNRRQYSPQAKRNKPFHYQNSPEQKMQQKMNKCFKQNTFLNFQTYVDKNKITKKSLIYLSADKSLQKITPQFCKTVEVKASRTTSTRTTSNNRPVQKINTFQRIKSSFTPKQKIFTSLNNNNQQIGKTSSLNMLDKGQQIDLKKITELKRYHQRQRLQMKLQSDFEEGHMKFIQKIMKSKVMSFNVKCGLDQIGTF